MTKHVHGGNIYTYKNCLDFSANCNPLGTPESVKQAVRDSLEYMKDYPALVVKLKWNQNAQTAMQQIKERNYPMSIEPYTGNILLVAINYDKTKKSHQCMIEKYIKKK